MHNLWLVARHEYRRMVVRRAFLLITLAVPLGMALLIGLIVLVESQGDSNLPVGYVDPTGQLDPSRQAALPDEEERLPIVPFADEQAAIRALEGGQVQAFFVLPDDYPDSLAVDLYFLQDPPSGDAWAEFDEFVRFNLAARYPPDVGQRLVEGPRIWVQDPASGRVFSDEAVINIVLPFAASILFMVATMSSSGYMLQVVADEKENRTMEIMLTSITPLQLISGKVLGLLAVALTQLAIYAATAVAGLAIANRYVPLLQSMSVPWGYLGVMALFFFPSFGLIAAVMVAIGSAVTEIQQGQQVAGLLNLVFMLPLLLLVMIFENPGGPLVVFLSLFPPTAFLTVSLRWGLGSVPAWQLVTAWVLLVSTLAFMVWAAARIFRAGMLQYGQPLNLKGALSALRTG